MDLYETSEDIIYKFTRRTLIILSLVGLESDQNPGLIMSNLMKKWDSPRGDVELVDISQNEISNK